MATARLLYDLYGLARRYCNAALLLLALAMPTQVYAATLIVALGDSLTAGFGLPPEQALPVRLEARLKEMGYDVRIENAGVSGDTTAGGLARLDWAMADNPKYALVALGANDMLRGLDPKQALDNLDRILGGLKQRGISPVLIGMRAQPNLGAEYARDFDAIYPNLAERHGVPLYPFMLEGIALQKSLNQTDGLHPNARGVEVMVDRIAPFLAGVLDKY